MPKKGQLGQFVDLGGAWQERGGDVFEGGVDTPMHTICNNWWHDQVNDIAVKLNKANAILLKIRNYVKMKT